MKTLSLFTGAGGLDLGFESAGFRIIGCVEIDSDARATIMANRPGWNLLPEGDIANINPAHLVKALSIHTRGLDLLLAGPPCQPFSKSAFWATGSTRRMKDPRSGTLRKLVKIIESALPKAIVIENVRGIAFAEKDDAIRMLKRGLQLINRTQGTRYRLAVIPMQATDYGVPQIRERVFLVAFRDGTLLENPAATHGSGCCPELLPVPTAWDAIGGIVPSPAEMKTLTLRGKWARLIPSIPEGHNYLWHTERGGGLPLFGWRTRFWSFLLKLARDKPSWTLQACPGPATGPFHWDNRLLSIREMARLQTFPDDYHICGNYGSARRQLGNAVPPALSEALARTIEAKLLNKGGRTRASFCIPVKLGRPAAEPASEVPIDYYRLVGKHAEHAGPGKGPGATLRGTKPADSRSQAA